MMATIMLKASFVPQHADDQNGVWKTRSGCSLVLCHASPDGELDPWAEEFLNKEPSAYVVCCHPNQVAVRHPAARVLGAWDGITDAYISGPIASGMSEHILTFREASQ